MKNYDTSNTFRVVAVQYGWGNIEEIKSFVHFLPQDILENDDIKLDTMFIASLVSDIIKVSHFQ